MDGWAVLATLKAVPDVAAIPVVMVSMTDDERLGLALGAAEFLSKPVDRGRLRAFLARLRPSADGDALVVDDDPLAREIMVRLLVAEGFAVREATNGREALACIAERRPRLVLLDLEMPVMDGGEFLHALRQHPEWRTVPVLVVTAQDLGPSERAALDGAVAGILRKGGMSSHDLLDEIRRVCPPSAPGTPSTR